MPWLLLMGIVSGAWVHILGYYDSIVGGFWVGLWWLGGGRGGVVGGFGGFVRHGCAEG